MNKLILPFDGGINYFWENYNVMTFTEFTLPTDRQAEILLAEIPESYIYLEASFKIQSEVSDCLLRLKLFADTKPLEDLVFHLQGGLIGTRQVTFRIPYCKNLRALGLTNEGPEIKVLDLQISANNLPAQNLEVMAPDVDKIVGNPEVMMTMASDAIRQMQNLYESLMGLSKRYFGKHPMIVNEVEVDLQFGGEEFIQNPVGLGTITIPPQADPGNDALESPYAARYKDYPDTWDGVIAIGFEGEQTSDPKWITTDERSLFRNTVFNKQGTNEIFRQTSDEYTLGHNALVSYTPVRDDNFNGYANLQLLLNLGLAQSMNLGIYRSTFNAVNHGMFRGDTNNISTFVKAGWPSWALPEGYEQARVFAIKVPASVKPIKRWPGSTLNGMDDPTAIHIWQCFGKYALPNPLTGMDLPAAIYWSNEHLWVNNLFDKKNTKKRESYGMGPKIADVGRDKWVVLAILTKPGTENGALKIATKELGDPGFVVKYDYEGPYYINYDDKFVGQEKFGNIPKVGDGQDQTGIYLNTRATQPMFQKHLAEENPELGLIFSHSFQACWKNGSSSFDEFLKYVNEYFKK